MSRLKGGFTIPGEAGYEKLTLELAEKWGADVVRDSDGTRLSEEILQAGYGVYSTLCLIRDHNEWARKNPETLQQCFLMTSPKTAAEDHLEIGLMEDYFDQQFQINVDPDAVKYWQVYDRTENKLLSRERWSYDAESRKVLLSEITPWHKYTVSFLAYRIWEEISMYNHTTNHWEKEHLMQLDPRYPKVQTYLRNWMIDWCEHHPETTVVRFTSMFYNFVWIWGSQERNRNLFTDWGSYDFTVSVRALEAFKEAYGYEMTAEDFINQGNLHVSHMPVGPRKKDWMAFINDFVISFGKELIDIVHSYGKQAYVFYDDSWVGIEPYNGRFREFGFDGMIKCVFSGFEARLCAGVPVENHEIRLHPYLFPVGLGGLPTFMEGGDPTLDAKKYWIHVRRALLREPIDRMGLGGYLHLTEGFPDFCDYIELISDEFRRIRAFHENGKPYVLKPRIAVLHTWGRMRSWTLSGHFHETYMHELIHVNESLSGLPFDVEFISFEDVKDGCLQAYDVVINAGYAKSAWSGGDAWKDTEIVEKLTEWVFKGGCFIGINQPSAVEGFDTFYRMAHVLGVDEDTGERVCHGRWPVEEVKSPFVPAGCRIDRKEKRYLLTGSEEVFLTQDGEPTVVYNPFGKGAGIYLSTFVFTPENIRLLQNLILKGCGERIEQEYITDNVMTECAYFPDGKVLVVINNSGQEQNTVILAEGQKLSFRLAPYETIMHRIGEV